jgi:Zn-dependent protease with chaperone function
MNAYGILTGFQIHRSSRCKRSHLVLSAFMCVVLLFVAISAEAQGINEAFGPTNPSEEVKLGREAALEVEKMIPPCRDNVMIRRVERLGAALVDSMPYKAYPYQFKVLASPEFNAFCLPGGFMYVYQGLLTRLPSDDSVAWVMGHELTHAAERHWAKKVEKMKGINLAAILLGTATGQTDIVNLTQALISASYSRQEENEADAGGLQLIWRAGYDLNGAKQAIQVMMDMEKGHAQDPYLSDHPTSEERMQHVTELISQLEKQPRPKIEFPGENSENQTLAVLTSPVPTSNPSPNPYFPLNPGRRWVYHVKTKDGSTNYTMNVRSGIQVGKGYLYRVRVLFDQMTPMEYQYVSDGSSVWTRSFPIGNGEGWNLAYDINAAAGSVENSGGVQYSTVGVESVATPCGTFSEALHVRELNSQGTTDLWFVKNIGLVKKVNSSTGDEETLVRYNLGDTNSMIAAAR